MSALFLARELALRYGFVRGAAKPGARIITDGLKSYDGRPVGGDETQPYPRGLGHTQSGAS